MYYFMFSVEEWMRYIYPPAKQLAGHLYFHEINAKGTLSKLTHYL